MILVLLSLLLTTSSAEGLDAGYGYTIQIQFCGQDICVLSSSGEVRCTNISPEYASVTASPLETVFGDDEGMFSESRSSFLVVKSGAVAIHCHSVYSYGQDKKYILLRNGSVLSAGMNQNYQIQPRLGPPVSTLYIGDFSLMETGCEGSTLSHGISSMYAALYHTCVVCAHDRRIRCVGRVNGGFQARGPSERGYRVEQLLPVAPWQRNGSSWTAPDATVTNLGTLSSFLPGQEVAVTAVGGSADVTCVVFDGMSLHCAGQLSLNRRLLGRAYKEYSLIVGYDNGFAEITPALDAANRTDWPEIPRVPVGCNGSACLPVRIVGITGSGDYQISAVLSTGHVSSWGSSGDMPQLQLGAVEEPRLEPPLLIPESGEAVSAQGKSSTPLLVRSIKTIGTLIISRDGVLRIFGSRSEGLGGRGTPDYQRGSSRDSIPNSQDPDDNTVDVLTRSIIRLPEGYLAAYADGLRLQQGTYVCVLMVQNTTGARALLRSADPSTDLPTWVLERRLGGRLRAISSPYGTELLAEAPTAASMATSLAAGNATTSVRMVSGGILGSDIFPKTKVVCLGTNSGGTLAALGAAGPTAQDPLTEATATVVSGPGAQYAWTNWSAMPPGRAGGAPFAMSTFSGRYQPRLFETLAAPAWAPAAKHVNCGTGQIPPAFPTAVVAASDVTCAVLSNLRLRCVGNHQYHSLGLVAPAPFWRSTLHYPNPNAMPLGTSPAELGNIELVGAPASEVGTTTSILELPWSLYGDVFSVAISGNHGCAVVRNRTVMAEKAVVCWGRNTGGELGLYPRNPMSVAPRNARLLSVGGAVRQVVVSESQFSCILRSDGAVVCFGACGSFKCGLGMRRAVQWGDNLWYNTVNVTADGRRVVYIAANTGGVIALVQGGYVRTFGSQRVSGMGDAANSYGGMIGDNEEPAELGDFYLPVLSSMERSNGLRVERVYGGASIGCAIVAPHGGLRCWGAGNGHGRGYHFIGYGSAQILHQFGDLDFHIGQALRVLHGSVADGGHCVIGVPRNGTWIDDPSNSTKPYRRVFCFGLAPSIARRSEHQGARSGLASAAIELDVGGDATSVAVSISHIVVLRDDGRTVFYGNCAKNQCGLPTAHIGDDENPSDWAAAGPHWSHYCCMYAGWGSSQASRAMKELARFDDRIDEATEVAVLADCSSHYSSSLHLRGSNVVGLEPRALSSLPHPLSLLDLSGTAAARLSRSSLAGVSLHWKRRLRVYSGAPGYSCKYLLSAQDESENAAELGVTNRGGWLGLSMRGINSNRCLLPPGVTVDAADLPTNCTSVPSSASAQLSSTGLYQWLWSGAATVPSTVREDWTGSSTPVRLPRVVAGYTSSSDVPCITEFTFGQPSITERARPEILSLSDAELDPRGGDTIEIPVFDDPLSHTSIGVLTGYAIENATTEELVYLGILPSGGTVQIRGIECTNVHWVEQVARDTRSFSSNNFEAITQGDASLPMYFLRATTPSGAFENAQVSVYLHGIGHIRPAPLVSAGSTVPSVQPVAMDFLAPSLEEVSPSHGSRAGGYNLIVRGSGFPIGPFVQSVEVEIATYDFGRRFEKRFCAASRLVNVSAVECLGVPEGYATESEVTVRFMTVDGADGTNVVREFSRTRDGNKVYFQYESPTIHCLYVLESGEPVNEVDFMARGCNVSNPESPPVLQMLSGGGQQLVIGGDKLHVVLDIAKNFVATLESVVLFVPRTREEWPCIDLRPALGGRAAACTLPAIVGSGITATVYFRGYQQPVLQVTIGNASTGTVDWNQVNPLDGRPVVSPALLAANLRQAPPLITSVLPGTIPTTGGTIIVGGLSFGMDSTPLELLFGPALLVSGQVSVPNSGHSQRKFIVPPSLGTEVSILPSYSGIQGKTADDTALLDYERPGMYAVYPARILISSEGTAASRGTIALANAALSSSEREYLYPATKYFSILGENLGARSVILPGTTFYSFSSGRAEDAYSLSVAGLDCSRNISLEVADDEHSNNLATSSFDDLVQATGIPLGLVSLIRCNGIDARRIAVNPGATSRIDADLSVAGQPADILRYRGTLSSNATKALSTSVEVVGAPLVLRVTPQAVTAAGAPIRISGSNMGADDSELVGIFVVASATFQQVVDAGLLPASTAKSTGLDSLFQNETSTVSVWNDGQAYVTSAGDLDQMSNLTVRIRCADPRVSIPSLEVSCVMPRVSYAAGLEFSTLAFRVVVLTAGGLSSPLGDESTALSFVVDSRAPKYAPLAVYAAKYPGVSDQVIAEVLIAYPDVDTDGSRSLVTSSIAEYQYVDSASSDLENDIATAMAIEYTQLGPLNQSAQDFVPSADVRVVESFTGLLTAQSVFIVGGMRWRIITVQVQLFGMPEGALALRAQLRNRFGLEGPWSQWGAPVLPRCLAPTEQQLGLGVSASRDSFDESAAALGYYLDTSSNNLGEVRCKPCPDGAFCSGGLLHEMLPLAGRQWHPFRNEELLFVPCDGADAVRRCDGWKRSDAEAVLYGYSGFRDVLEGVRSRLGFNHEVSNAGDNRRSDARLPQGFDDFVRNSSFSALSHSDAAVLIHEAGLVQGSTLAEAISNAATGRRVLSERSGAVGVDINGTDMLTPRHAALGAAALRPSASVRSIVGHVPTLYTAMAVSSLWESSVQCGSGYTGPLCAACTDGFSWSPSRGCRECPATWVTVVVGCLVAILCMTALALAIYSSIRSRGHASATHVGVAKIIVNHLQQISLAATFELQWPSSVASMLEGFDTTSSAGMNLITFECAVNDGTKQGDSRTKWMVSAALVESVPIILVLAITIFWACAYAYLYQSLGPESGKVGAQSSGLGATKDARKRRSRRRSVLQVLAGVSSTPGRVNGDRIAAARRAQDSEGYMRQTNPLAAVRSHSQLRPALETAASRLDSIEELHETSSDSDNSTGSSEQVGIAHARKVAPATVERRIRTLRRDLGLDSPNGNKRSSQRRAAVILGDVTSGEDRKRRNTTEVGSLGSIEIVDTSAERAKTEKRLDRIPEKWILSVGVVLFLLHTLLTRTALQLLTCRNIVEGGQQYLLQDLSVACFSYPHSSYVAGVAIPALFLWTLGIPMLVVGIITMRRDSLGTGQLRRSLGFFYSSYKQQYYWNEAIIIARKTASAVAGVMLQPLGADIQAFASATVYVLFRAIHSRTQPYISDTLNSLDELSLDVAVLSLLAGLFLNTGKLGSGVRVFATLFLIGINALFLAYAVGSGYLEMRARVYRNEAELVRLERTTGPSAGLFGMGESLSSDLARGRRNEFSAGRDKVSESVAVGKAKYCRRHGGSGKRLRDQEAAENGYLPGARTKTAFSPTERQASRGAVLLQPSNDEMQSRPRPPPKPRAPNETRP